MTPTCILLEDLFCLILPARRQGAACEHTYKVGCSVNANMPLAQGDWTAAVHVNVRCLWVLIICTSLESKIRKMC